MINLVRMDLYRLLKSKSVYICLAILLATSVLCFWIVWMFDTPEGNESAARIGMSAITEIGVPGTLLINYDTLHMFREIAMDGGAYISLFGIVIVLFFCSDYNSGFMKNIMSLHRRRWKYIASKLITAGILDFCYLALHFGICMLLNVLFHNLVPFAPAGDTLSYLCLTWTVTMGFAALLLLICTVTRSNGAGILATILLGSGILVLLVSYITSLFGINQWAYYTLYYNHSQAPYTYNAIGDFKGYAVGAGFLVLYAVISAVPLARKDI